MKKSNQIDMGLVENCLPTPIKKAYVQMKQPIVTQVGNNLCGTHNRF